jgi:hypothetical protein
MSEKEQEERWREGAEKRMEERSDLEEEKIDETNGEEKRMQN